MSVLEYTTGRRFVELGLPPSENSDKMDGEVDKERSRNRLRVPLWRQNNKANEGESVGERERANKRQRYSSEPDGEGREGGQRQEGRQDWCYQPGGGRGQA